MSNFSDITVITAVRNNPEGLERLQESICSLNVEIEWIIVDDNGKSVKNLSDKGSPLIFQKKTTIYEAFNIGLEAATSSHVIFVGSDDYLLPSLDSLVEELRRSDVDVFCALPRGKYTDNIFSLDSLLRYNYCQQGLVYNRELILKYGFNTRYPIAADYLLNLQLAIVADLKVESRPFEIVHFSDGGVSSTTWDTLFHVEWHRHSQLIPSIKNSPNFDNCIRRLKSARLIRLSQRGIDGPSFRSMFHIAPRKQDLSALIQGLKRRLF